MRLHRLFGLSSLRFVPFIVAGCATESVPLPEATLTTPGAFVAVDPETSEMSLLRVLESFAHQDDTILVFTEYDVTPESWGEAEEIAKSPEEPPIRFLETVGSYKGFTKNEYRIVWYRTLTDEERDRAK